MMTFFFWSYQKIFYLSLFFCSLHFVLLSVFQVLLSCLRLLLYRFSHLKSGCSLKYYKLYNIFSLVTLSRNSFILSISYHNLYVPLSQLYLISGLVPPLQPTFKMAYSVILFEYSATPQIQHEYSYMLYSLVGHVELQNSRNSNWDKGIQRVNFSVESAPARLAGNVLRDKANGYGHFMHGSGKAKPVSLKHYQGHVVMDFWERVEMQKVVYSQPALSLCFGI